MYHLSFHSFKIYDWILKIPSHWSNLSDERWNLSDERSYISRNNTFLYLTSIRALNTVYGASAEGNKFLAHVIRHGVYLWNIKGLFAVGPGHRCTFYVHDTVRRKILSQQLPLGPSKLALLDHSYDLLSSTLQVTISKFPYWIFMIVLLTLCGCIVCYSQLCHDLVPNLIFS